MENSFKSIVEKSKSVLILLPTKPYFDQVAAGLSLYLALRDEKQVQISTPAAMIVEFNRLIGVNKVTQELGNKNMVIRFSDYKANDIERVSYDIEDGQFRLTVIPKPSVKPPTKEQVNFSYSGVSTDTIVLIGGANESHFPAISSKDLVGANLIHIGIRDVSLPSNKNYISLSRPASSVSEVVYSLIKESSTKLDQDIATNLLMGIEQGSDNFKNSEVNADTFLVISELMKAGGKRLSNIPLQGVQPTSSVTETPPTPTDKTLSEITRTQGQQALPEVKEGKKEQPPKEWLGPKIYKGASIS